MTVQAKELAIQDITAFYEELGICPSIQDSMFIPGAVFVAPQGYRENYDVAVFSLDNGNRDIEVYVCHLSQDNRTREKVGVFVVSPERAVERVQESIAEYESLLAS